MERQDYKTLLLVLFAASWSLVTALAVDTAARHSFLLWLEHWTGDWRTSFFADRRASQHDRVAIVAITDETLSAFPYRTPVDRAYLARLLETLDGMGAEAIGLDFLFIRGTEPGKDTQLASRLRAMRTPVVIAAADKRVGLSDPERAYQSAFLRKSQARAGFANLLTGSDHIVRYLAPPAQDSPFKLSFAQMLAAPQAPALDKPRRIAWLLKPEDNSDTFTTLPAHLIQPPGTEEASPMAAAFAGLVEGKIVMIGAILPDIDRHATPLPDWEGDDQAGIFLQAQAVAQIVDDRNIRRLHPELLRALFATLAAFGLVFGFRHGRLAYTAYGGMAALAIAALDVALFVSTRQFLPFGACILALVIGLAGGGLMRRLIRFV